MIFSQKTRKIEGLNSLDSRHSMEKKEEKLVSVTLQLPGFDRAISYDFQTSCL